MQGKTRDVTDLFLELQLVGASAKLREALDAVQRIARTDAPVHISGETGTGKELFARALHYLGPRSSNAFVPVNCGALPEGLLESELFGHVRGAFTDAKQNQLGLIRLADEGTLFLDEVDSLSAKGQAALLRFLQDGEFRPVGSATVSKANVRIITATNACLKRASAERQFRSDLLFRLAVLFVRLPPLRERQGDISLLVEHFMRKCATTYGGNTKRVSPATLELLEAYSWPGNVRELQNWVHAAYVLSEGDTLTLPPHALAGPSPAIRIETPAPADVGLRARKSAAVAHIERSYLEQLLRSTGGNVSEAARIAQHDRRVLGRLLKKHGIQRSAFCD
jgi:two-component system, NtrC family, response regulator GlrR